MANTLTGKHQFLAEYTQGDAPVLDPNLFTAADILAYGMVDSVAISSATSKAVSTVNAAAPDSSSISTASSKATSAAGQGSVADSKAVSVSTNTSVADSKAVSVSGNTSVADSKAVSVGAATIIATVNGIPGFVQPVAGATVRSANGKMAEWYSLKDFGLTAGGGINDDRPAFILATAFIGAAGLILPPGTYRIASNLTLSCPVMFQPGAILKPDANVTVTLNGPVAADVQQIVNTAAAGSALAFGSSTIPMAFPQWWGAKGDGVNDDTNAIKAAMAAAAWVYLVAGTYLFSSVLTVPTNCTLCGAGYLAVTLKPTSALNGMSCIRYGNNSSIRELLVNGTNTAGSVGVVIGDLGAVVADLDAHNLRIANFLGSNAVGFKAIDAVDGRFDNLVVANCDTNLVTHGTQGTPTDLLFINPKFNSATHKGVNLYNGYNIHFIMPKFESNGEEGFYCNNTADSLDDVVVEKAWFENNQLSLAGGARAAAFSAWVNGTGSSHMRVRFNNCVDYGTSFKALRLTNCGFAVDNHFVGNVGTRIQVDDPAFGNFSNWPGENGTTASTISNTSTNRVTYDGIEMAKTFTPVFADASSGGNVSVTAAQGNWTRAGDMVTVWIQVDNLSTAGMTGTNSLYIRGLPFASVQAAQGSVYIYKVPFTVAPPTAIIGNGVSYVRLFEYATGAVDHPLLVSEVNSGNSSIYVTITYRIAQP